MKHIDLDSISYKHRFNGASLLISKANRLCGLQGLAIGQKTDDKTLLAALSYYDMALSLMKPFDPNYATVVNWKCLVLWSLRQFDEAASWYREIVRIADETEGKAARNATAALAEQMIAECEGRGNEPLKGAVTDATAFDDPPFCMVGEQFCTLLAQKKFKKAHACLSPTLKETVSAAKLKQDWQSMIGNPAAADISISLEQHMLDWPDRRDDDLGWCYFSVSTEELSEAVALVVAKTPQNGYWLRELEFGRP